MGWSLLIFAAIAAVATAYFYAVGPKTVWRQMYGSPDLGPFLLADLKRNTRPNDALLCTPGACPHSVEVDGELASFDVPPEDMLQKVIASASELSVDIEAVESGTSTGSVRFVTWTPGLGFPDTNQFWAVTLPDGKTGLVAYARAQVGYSDQGNNLARLKKWTSMLTEAD
ncbi:MAG: hypothetical protein AAFO77_05135 [Pseudomonadota bacterium]